MESVESTSAAFRYRCLKLAVAFVALWLLILSGALLAGGGCSRADMSRVNTLPVGCARPSLPLRVAFEVDSQDFAQPVLLAAQAWSDAVGKPVARLAAPGEEVDLMVVDGPRDPKHPDWDAEAETVRDPASGRCYQTVTFMTGFDLVAEYYFTLHEMGHVLGLKDSPNQDSVMYHWISPSVMGGEAGPDAEEQPFPYISDVDSATLRALY